MAFFTKKEDDFLRQNYLTIPAKRMSRMLNRSESGARQRMAVLNLKVPATIIAKFKRDSQIKPGNIPSNKGKKMPANIYKKIKHTFFKPGHLPHNTKKNGVISLRKQTMRNGQITFYQWVRISKAKWKMLHVLNWEKKYGKVPAGYIVVFKDKNTMNANLKNLELIALAENMRRNTIHNLPPDLKKSIRVITSLNRKIKKHEKQIM